MARPQTRIKRRVSSTTFTDNQRVSIDLPRDYDLEAVMIRISGSTTLTVAGTAVRAEAPLQLLKFISLKANGTDLLDGLPGTMAHRLGAFRRGQLAPLTPPGAATVSTQAFAGVVMLDRCVIDGIRSKDGNFPTRGLSSFQLEIQFGAATDLFTGSPTGTIAAGATVEVFVIQSKEEPIDGKFTLPKVVSKRTHLDLAFASTNTNFIQRLNTGNILRGLVIRAAGASTAGEPSNTGLNNVKIVQGNEVLLDLTAAALQAMNAQDYEISSIPTGYYFVDFMGMGAPANKLSDALDMRRGEELNVVLDVTGATNQTIGITTLEYMPFNPKYWGLAA